MENTHRNKINPSILFLSLAVMIGGYIRTAPILLSSFPLNDGGLFFTMTKDLMANNYRLPQTTTYNHLDLPFAYPPLPFYFTGLLTDITNWELINLLRYLPVLFSVLTIPAFFLLAQDFSNRPVQAGIATIIFAMIPATFDWLIMGGGLTRAPAFFFALLTLHRIHKLYTRNQTWDIFSTALLATLTVLTHPETALHTAFSAIVFYLFFSRNKSGFIRSLAVAGLTLLLTSPWWITVLSRHGLAPFLAAGQTGLHNSGAIFQLLQFDLTHEYGLQSVAVLALLGFFWHLVDRTYFLPAWLLIIFISEPRSAPLYTTPCISLLASFTLINILEIFNRQSSISSLNKTNNHPFISLASKLTFGVLFAQWTLSALVTTQMLTNNTTLTSANQIALNWVSENTPPKSRFLVLTGSQPLTDPTSEWFPALTERSSVATVQGYEWDKSNNFEDILIRARDIQKCTGQNYLCIQNWSVTHNIKFEYIYISKLATTSVVTQEIYTSALEDLLISNSFAEPVYQSEEVTILKLEPDYLSRQ